MRLTYSRRYLRISFELAVESKQRDPLIVVVSLPDEMPMKMKRNSLGGQIVMEAEIALIEGLALGPKAQERR